MSMFGLLGSSVSGIKAQGSAMANVSDNLANANTTGYKGAKTSFYSLVDEASVGGGVRPYDSRTIDVQGELSLSPINTHLAISGNGMFTVRLEPDNDSELFFTRSGAFAPDHKQNLVNGEGAYLLGWKVEEGDMTDKPKLGALEAISFKDLGTNAVATTKVEVGVNLNAEEDAMSGRPVKVMLTSKDNRMIGMDDPIVSDGTVVDVGDGFVASLGDGVQHTLRYGGLANTSKVSNDHRVLGAISATDVFKDLNEGDQFIISSESSGHFALTFSKNAPDVASGYFNSMHTLSKAIDMNPNFSSRIVDEKVYIAPNKAYEQMLFTKVDKGFGFANRVTADSTGIYGNDSPLSTLNSFVIDASAGLYGAKNSTLPFHTGINNGDSFKVRFSNGAEHVLSFNTQPNLGLLQFNSLKSLADAFNSIDGVKGQIVNGNQLQVISDDALVSIKSNDSARLAENLGIGVNSVFRERVSHGDKMRIEVGGFEKVTSTEFKESDVIGAYTRVASDDMFKVEALGIKKADDKIRGLADGDGFKLVTSGNPAGFEIRYKGGGAANQANGEFDSLKSLRDALAAVASAEIAATVDGGKLVLDSVTGKSLSEVSSLGQGKLLEALGWSFGKVAVNDSVEIVLDSGEKLNFVFSGASKPDIKASRFNTVANLKDAILFHGDGRFEVNIVGGKLNVVPVKGKLSTTINSVSGRIADVLGIARKTQMAEVKFVQDNPVVGSGEFNDLLSLSQAINGKFDFLNTGLDSQGRKMWLRVEDDAQLKYVSDANVSGRSDFASRLGIRGADIVAGLGLIGTKSDSKKETFASMRGLNHLLSVSDGLSGTELQGDKLGIVPTNVTEKMSFANASGNSGNGSFLSWMGLPNEGFAPAYDALDSSKNMASGVLDPHYFHSVRVYDSLGSDHEVRFAFAKLEQNRWTLEIFSPESDALVTDRADGLIASALLDFGGDGLLNDIKFKSVFAGGDDGVVSLSWKNGSDASKVLFDLGFKRDKEDRGLRQFSDQYLLGDSVQNGYGIGSMTRFEVNDSGYVTAHFSNGVSRKVYQVPIAEFPNFNGLQILSGSLYQQNFDSGAHTLRTPDQAVGNLLPNTLEGSNVAVFDQLVTMVIAKKVYQANVKVLQSVDHMLEEMLKSV